MYHAPPTADAKEYRTLFLYERPTWSGLSIVRESPFWGLEGREILIFFGLPAAKESSAFLRERVRQGDVIVVRCREMGETNSMRPCERSYACTS